MPKYFIITVDTEGDNLWEPYQTKEGHRDITTKNAEVLWQFQELCEKYDFKPTYLTDYEMAISDDFRRMADRGLKHASLEIGMHMHAWNCPPLYDLPFNEHGHNAFQGEYPYEVLKEKTLFITNLLKENFQTEIVSHRAGRWYLDRNVTKILDEAGYIADCSVTPMMSWSNTIGNRIYGPDYTDQPSGVYYLKDSKLAEVDNKIVEIPPTVMKIPFIGGPLPGSINELKVRIANSTSWLRPSGYNLKTLLYMVRKKSMKDEYLEFMIHSSELMAAGSPNFKTDGEIKKLYSDMDKLFAYIKTEGYEGICLGNYAKKICSYQ